MPDKIYIDIDDLSFDTKSDESFGLDLDGKVNRRVVTGKSLKDLFILINNTGFLNGEVFDGFLCEENEINEFKTFHFFNQGEEVFSIILGFNSDTDIGALKIQPGPTIDRFFFVQGINLGNEPTGSIMGALFAIGGSGIVFELLTDAGGFFELQNNNQIVSTLPIPEGIYELFVKASGDGGTQYVDQVTIQIFATALISNISLSNILVEEGAPIGTIVGALSTSGGEAPITFTILSQTLSSAPTIQVDIFEIVNDAVQTKAGVGVDGISYRLFIEAQDSRVGLPPDDRVKVEEFDINVVASTFTNVNSLSFDAVDEHINIPHDISLWGGQNFSGSFWIKPNNKGSNQYIAAKFGPASFRSWGLRLNTDGKVAIVYSQTGVASDTTTTTSTVTFGIWSHVAFSFDGTLGTPKMKIWINGILEVDEDTLLTSLFNNSTIDMLIGAINQPLPTVASDHFDGLIDEAAIYNTSLDTAKVQEIYNLGVPNNLKALTSSAGLISWWRMGDDFSGGTQPDFEGSNDGDGINMNNSNRSTDVPA